VIAERSFDQPPALCGSLEDPGQAVFDAHWVVSHFWSESGVLLRRGRRATAVPVRTGQSPEVSDSSTTC
jgi:hypothetical protein